MSLYLARGSSPLAPLTADGAWCWHSPTASRGQGRGCCGAPDEAQRCGRSRVLGAQQGHSDRATSSCTLVQTDSRLVWCRAGFLCCHECVLKLRGAFKANAPSLSNGVKHLCLPRFPSLPAPTQMGFASAHSSVKEAPGSARGKQNTAALHTAGQRHWEARGSREREF